MEVIGTLNEHYSITFDSAEMQRNGGSTSYTVFSGDKKYFLRVVKPAFFKTAAIGVQIQVFLQNKGFPVPSIMFTKTALPYVKTEKGLFILYNFIEGSESDPEQDYIGRYIDLLKKKNYPKVDKFQAYGETLWNKVKELPRGFCHGDMYDGNIHKTLDGDFYVLDFDTSCEGFPMYDPALICNKTDYFNYDEGGQGKSKEIFSRFLSGYLKHNVLSQPEIDAFYDMVALYHFALQATIIEIHGIDCVDNTFLDKQLDWLYRWRAQCENELKNKDFEK